MDGRPPLGEDAGGVLVDIGEADGAESFGFGGDGESSDPGEKVEVGEVMHWGSPSGCGRR